MSYEVLTEWSGNVVKWLFRYSIKRSEVAERAGISETYLIKTLRDTNPYVSSCLKIDHGVANCLRIRGFNARSYLQIQSRARKKLPNLPKTLL